jgi:hypothetical protein
LDEEIKEEEIGEACRTHERREICAKFWLEDLKERDQLEDLGEDGRIILNEF